MYPAEVTGVRVLDGFRVELRFRDGAVRTVDLEPFLHGPVFDPVRRDPAQFRKVRVDPELRTIAWPNGADIDPDVLRWDLRPAT